MKWYNALILNVIVTSIVIFAIVITIMANITIQSKTVLDIVRTNSGNYIVKFKEEVIEESRVLEIDGIRYDLTISTISVNDEYYFSLTDNYELVLSADSEVFEITRNQSFLSYLLDNII